MLAAIALLIAFVSPLILLPIEKILPYPFIFEEFVKLLAIRLIILQERRGRVNLFALVPFVGILFTISESVLYLVNILAIGEFSLLLMRLLLTGALHTGTAMLIYFFGKKTYILLSIGFIGAIIIHYLFNVWIVNLG